MNVIINECFNIFSCDFSSITTACLNVYITWFDCILFGFISSLKYPAADQHVYLT